MAAWSRRCGGWRITNGSLVLVVAGRRQEALARPLAGLDGVAVVADPAGIVAAEFGVTGVPIAYLLDGAGVVLGAARGLPQVRTLLRPVVESLSSLLADEAVPVAGRLPCEGSLDWR